MAPSGEEEGYLWHFEVNEPSRYASAAATRALSLAGRVAPVMMDSRTPTTGLMPSVMPGRLSDHRGCAAERRCGPPARRSVAGTHRHRAPHPPTRWWPCVGGGDSTSWLWGSSPRGDLHANHTPGTRRRGVSGLASAPTAQRDPGPYARVDHHARRTILGGASG